MDTVTIRSMSEADCSEIADIWLQGLEQTAEGLETDVASQVRASMQQYGEKACSLEGDVGPEGCFLYERWNGKPAAIMYVAEYEGRVVGSVAVQQGMDLGEPHDDSTVASIWRMSVSNNVRRKGVGQKLMETAEAWAKSRSCTCIQLYTANLVAGAFYEKLGFDVVSSAEISPEVPVDIKTYKKAL